MKTYQKFHNEKAGRFWEIEVKGKVVIQNSGKISGGVRNGSEDEFSATEEALREVEKLIAGKIAEGFQKVAESDAVIEDIVAKAEAIIANLKAAIQKDSLPYISLGIESLDDKELKPWQSNIGVRPYWPLEMELPRDTDGKELLFFGQINLEELPKLAGYPEKGLLVFFLHEDHSDFEDEARVIYFEKIITDIGKLIDSSGITFVTEGTYQITAPSEIDISHPYPPDQGFDQIMEQYTIQNEKVMELVEEEIAEWEHENTGHRMGGYAFFTQEDPRGYENCQDYLNLFQIDELDDDMMLWGDSGIAHFLIHPDDLAKRDFSKVMFVWDCY